LILNTPPQRGEVFKIQKLKVPDVDAYDISPSASPVFIPPAEQAGIQQEAFINWIPD